MQTYWSVAFIPSTRFVRDKLKCTIDGNAKTVLLTLSEVEQHVQTQRIDSYVPKNVASGSSWRWKPHERINILRINWNVFLSSLLFYLLLLRCLRHILMKIFSLWWLLWLRDFEITFNLVSSNLLILDFVATIKMCKECAWTYLLYNNWLLIMSMISLPLLKLGIYHLIEIFTNFVVIIGFKFYTYLRSYLLEGIIKVG